jgi:hypothetical protein
MYPFPTLGRSKPKVLNSWADRQLPDGTVIWKSPTGKTYKTRHGSRIFFPACDTTTVPRLSPVVQDGNRSVMMPRRHPRRRAEQTATVRGTKATFMRREGHT